MGKFLVFLAVCCVIGLFISPVLGLVIFVGGLMGIGLLALLK